MSRDDLARELCDICVDEYNDVIKQETIAVANEKAWKIVADHVSKLVIDELNLAKGKIALNNYHVGQSVDLSWIDHRLAELESQGEKQ